MNLLLIIGILFHLYLGINSNIPIYAKISRAKCTVGDKELVVNVSCFARPINRNVTVANISGYVTREVKDFWWRIKMYRKTTVFKPWLVDVMEDFCSFFTQQSGVAYTKILYGVMATHTNLVHTCPYNGFLYIKDMPLQANQLRDILPAGEYRIDMIIFFNKAKLPSVTVELHLIFEERFLIGK